MAVPNLVVEWFTITAPNDIHDLDTPLGKTWFSTLELLWRRRTRDGYVKTHWGRVIEDPDQVWIWTCWKSRELYDVQRHTDEHLELQALLADLSTKPPSTSLILLDSAWNYTRHLDRIWPSITFCYYPAELSDSQRSQIRQMRFLSSFYSTGLRDSTTTSHVPLRGFLIRVDGPSLIPVEQDEEVYILLDFWKTPIREEEVLGPEPPLRYSSHHGDFVPPARVFESQLRQTGCKRKIVKHATFKRLIGVQWPQEEVKADTTDFDWVKGRQEREEEKKAIHHLYGNHEEEEEEDEKTMEEKET